MFVLSLESRSNDLPRAISDYSFKKDIKLSVEGMASIIPMQKEVWDFKYTHSLSHSYLTAYIIRGPHRCLSNELGTMEKQTKYFPFFTYFQVNFETLKSKSKMQTIPNLLLHLPSPLSTMLMVCFYHLIFHNTTLHQYSL